MSRHTMAMLVAVVIIMVAILGVMFSLNAAKVRACHLRGGEPVTSFGLVVECDHAWP